MITSLRLRNFKRFADASFDLRPMTVLTGVNGTGKSTVIQALLLLRQFCRSRDDVVQLNGPFGLALGEAHEVLHFGASGPGIALGLTTSGGTRDFDFEVPEERALQLRVGDREAAFSVVLLGLYDRLFTYLCAERLGPRDLLAASGEKPESIGVGVQGEYTAQVLALHERRQVRAQLLHPATEQHGVTTLRTQVESWASEILRPVRISASWPDGITGSIIRFQDTGMLSEPVRPTNMGFGFSYALPVIVAGLLTQPDDLLIVENPEAHLHPGGQSKLGRFLARVAGSGAQVIVETHSDHVLNGIRLGAAEERVLQPSDTIIQYFGDSASASGVTPVELTSRGELTAWPEGFFDQIEQDLGRLARARRRDRR